MIFSYLDAQTLGSELTQAQYWSHALQALYEKAALGGCSSSLSQAYHICVENDFGAFVLERLLAQMRQENWSLVLLLDEFDVLLHHPILNSAEFFGSLRSLASRSQGALALVIACRCPLSQLNVETQEFNRTGSPYFNFLDEITLGPLAAKAIDALLDRAGNRFTTEDRQFIRRVAGGHPFLLQVTASALWEASEEDSLTKEDRYKEAGQIAHDQAAGTLSDTWRLWAPETKKLFSVIALAHLSTLPDEHEERLKGRIFDTEKLFESLRDFGPELRSLKKQGFIDEDKDVPGGFCVRPAAFLWWTIDEVVRSVRSETELGKWIQEQEWGRFFKRGEVDRLSGGIRWVGEVVRTGATEFIKAMAKTAGG